MIPETEEAVMEEEAVDNIIPSEEPVEKQVSEEASVNEEIPVAEEAAVNTEETQEEKKSPEEDEGHNEEKKKTAKVKKDNIFTRITWKIAKKVGGAVNDAINAGYDSMEDE